jgi:hypothetical protein
VDIIAKLSPRVWPFSDLKSRARRAVTRRA